MYRLRRESREMILSVESGKESTKTSQYEEAMVTRLQAARVKDKATPVLVPAMDSGTWN